MKSPSKSGVKAYGNITFIKWLYYWEISVEYLLCCQDYGITEKILPTSFKPNYWKADEDFDNTVIGLPKIIPGYDCGPNNTGMGRCDIKSNVFGFYLDMDNKIFILFNKTQKKIYKEKKFDFSLALFF